MQFIGEPYKAGGNIGSLDHGRKHADNQQQEGNRNGLFRAVIDGFPEAVIVSFLSEHGADQQCHEGSHCKRVHFKCFQYDKI